MKRRCLRNSVLFLGFGLYLLACAGMQILLFQQYAAAVGTVGRISLVPLGMLTAAWLTPDGPGPMPVAMWLQLMGLMVPFGFCLFLWVEDCTSFRSIAALTLCFSGLLVAGNYLLTAPVFNIDFLLASLCGAYIGYGAALAVVEVLFGKRIHPMLTSAAGRKTA